VRVYGRLKAFNNRRHVGVHAMRAVTDFNEINYHFLEATATHLYFTRGPLDAGGAKPLGNAAAAGEGGMFVEQDARAQGNATLANMTSVARKVFTAIQNAPQNNEGLHVQNIASILGLQINDVFKAGDELLGMGVIYTTVDDETWAVLEY
jgi:replication factor A2